MHPHTAGTNSSAQQKETPAERLPTGQQQQQQGLDPEASQPGSLQPPKDVTAPCQLHESQGGGAADGAQQQGQVQQPQARPGIGIGTPTGPNSLDSMTKQDPQQLLLQQLAAQAGFQLVSPPSQSAGSAQAAMHHQAEQGTPMQATLPHQQQWAALSHAKLDQDLDHKLSQGLLHQLGQGLQSSAMHHASMQQQQVQNLSRLPAWAQQALLPDQTPPVTPPAAYYGMPGLSPAHSMQALPSLSGGQYTPGGQLHEQYDPAGMRASLAGGSWHLPSWQQPQQAQATPHWLLDQHAQHAQQYGSMAAAESLHHNAVQSSGPYHTPHRSSPIDVRSSHAAAFWPCDHGGADMRTLADPQGRHSPPMMQSQMGDADTLHSQGSATQQQHSSRGEAFLPGIMQGSPSDTAMPAKLSLQDPSQAEMGVPSVLSGGSSGVSSPLRGSGHLESLVEVNNRVEAAMGRARAQLQVDLTQDIGWSVFVM